ncbi:MAG: hypothetical protein EOP84_00295 [Verrucomicrobiaceae bacterium]|nr:MAG: hypothetical protein EOP84_00295 [Verrucomicrobiaceae bacterium]
MARVKLHAGDFGKGEARFEGGKFQFPKGLWFEWVKEGQLEELEAANEETVKRVGGTVGWGAAGLVVLGPVGLLAGLLAGGRGKDVTFVAKFKDGRKMMATTDSKTFIKMKAVLFK